ncbi:MAG TPA: glutamine-hydrolyzing GMP synthase [Termitinemataceae bacterium]|nr:glutamine-hydrolyzing GMP synthase [Termitinemataceae bacterium]HOM22612.1 glutamine-hydrolyzing GMP synthase [Termitinemataceae bacterium]HPP99452.1 glutamine-hydrolyzing GMP synthase [Termitinemataceae bacterium]
MDKIVILDFGSQTTQLIGRRIREWGVYTEIYPGDSPLTEELLHECRGIILSGSPFSVYEKDAPRPDPRLYSLGFPLLGICYGLQRMTADLGGRVEALPEREYGAVRVTLASNLDWSAVHPAARALLSPLIESGTFTAWMSHGDSLSSLAPGFVELATSSHGFPAIVAHRQNPWFGFQFHPEVTHCEKGFELLRSFALEVCGARPQWSMAQYVEEVRQNLARRVGKEPVLLLISGGVDSTVAGALLLKTLDPSQVHLMYLDTGLMRKNETTVVRSNLERLGAQHLHIIHCEDEFLSALEGLTDPEEKRRTIGDLFISIQEREVARLKLPDTYFLAQGTLYTDLIESGKGVGKKAHVIKSHHNVRSPLVEAKRAAGKIIEPLDRLYKDEVRALGRLLGVSEDVVRRHPFPGPGLAVRILGEVTREKCDILREVDAIYIEELKKRGLYDAIWQAFAVLLPIRSVGVAGDVRKYGYVVALRAITSEDGMTADVFPFPMKDLLEISTLITNTVPAVGRVTYDISSKPPATIEWE